jgi:predicted nucleic acid-binding protein
MPGFLPDTSCIVPALCTWHEHHVAAAAEIERRLARAEVMHLAAPGLVEAYAVLTRMPPPYRLAPADALALLEASFIGLGHTVALAARVYVRLVRTAPADGVAGGRTYDRVIAACARAAGAAALLTFNERNFAPFAGPGLAVVVPSAT